MKRGVALLIAWRYLFSRKSHTAVTAVTAISVTGVAVATAAIVCVLSVFNGFQSLLTAKLGKMEPDLQVTSRLGKVFSHSDSLAQEVSRLPGVALASPSLTDNALALLDGREVPVTLKGVVPEAFDSITLFRSLLLEGSDFDLSRGEGSQEIWDDEMQEYVSGEGPWGLLLSVGAAARLGVREVGQGILLFAPRREGRVNLANPIASFLTDSVTARGVWQSDMQDFDLDMVMGDLGLVRTLLQYTHEASALDIKTTGEVPASELASKIEALLGPGFQVKDRLQQHEINYRMVSIEKWVTFLLLSFILVIAAFNLIGTLSMLVIEKRDSLSLLQALGASRGGVAAVFRWESLYVTLIGAVAGMAVGILLCWLQQEYGFIKLNGDSSTLVMASYPVEFRWMDLLAVAVPLAIIGGCTAWIAGRFAKSRM